MFGLRSVGRCRLACENGRDDAEVDLDGTQIVEKGAATARATRRSHYKGINEQERSFHPRTVVTHTRFIANTVHVPIIITPPCA